MLSHFIIYSETYIGTRLIPELFQHKTIWRNYSIIFSEKYQKVLSRNIYTAWAAHI